MVFCGNVLDTATVQNSAPALANSKPGLYYMQINIHLNALAAPLKSTQQPTTPLKQTQSPTTVKPVQPVLKPAQTQPTLKSTQPTQPTLKSAQPAQPTLKLTQPAQPTLKSVLPVQQVQADLGLKKPVVAVKQTGEVLLNA